MAPSDVTPDNEDVVRARLYPVQTKSLDWKFTVNDKARVAMQRRPFQKGYWLVLSTEIFVVATRMPTASVTYRLKDVSGDVVKGMFDCDELQIVSKRDDALRNIERIG